MNKLFLAILLISVSLSAYNLWHDLNTIPTSSLAGTTAEPVSMPSLIYTGGGRTDVKLLTIAAGEDQAVYTNNTGYTEYVRYGQLTTSGTASSSFDVYLFASTSASIAAQHDYVDIVPGANFRLIVSTFATSAVATTTNSITALESDTGDGIIELRNGNSILFALQAGDRDCPRAATINGGCEAATSTNTGIGILTAVIETIATNTTVR